MHQNWWRIKEIHTKQCVGSPGDIIFGVTVTFIRKRFLHCKFTLCANGKFAHIPKCGHKYMCTYMSAFEVLLVRERVVEGVTCLTIVWEFIRFRNCMQICVYIQYINVYFKM